VSEYTRRRIAALLLLAGIVVGVLALLDVGPFEDPPTEEERVQDVVEDLFASAASGDAKGFCELLTRDARRALTVRTAQQLRLNEAPKCVHALTLLSGVFRGARVKVNLVSVSGPQARAEVDLKLKGAEPEPRTVMLVQTEGEWLVSDPG